MWTQVSPVSGLSHFTEMFSQIVLLLNLMCAWVRLLTHSLEALSDLSKPGLLNHPAADLVSKGSKMVKWS